MSINQLQASYRAVSSDLLAADPSLRADAEAMDLLDQITEVTREIHTDLEGTKRLERMLRREVC